MSRLEKIKEFLLDLLFPPLCVSCGHDIPSSRKTSYLCLDCESKIKIHDALHCSVCGNRLPTENHTCHEYSGFRLGAATDYDTPVIKRLIWQLKYAKQTAASRSLAYILHRFISQTNVPFDGYALVAIPLHSERERERGFNQAMLIGQFLSQKTGMTLITDGLIRIKNTPPQVELETWKDREANMIDAFSIKNAEAVRDRKVIVLDDVATSGATLYQAIRTLRKAGAKKVIGLVVAKAGR